jgi:hypothetical protein
VPGKWISSQLYAELSNAVRRNWNSAELLFLLFPHSIGRTRVTFTKAHIVLPTIEIVLNFSEEVVLQPNAASSVNVQLLDVIATRVASRSQLKGADVTRIIDALQENDNSGPPTSRLWFICFIVISVIIRSLLSILFTLFKCCYDYLRKHVNPLTPNQQLEAPVLQKCDDHGLELHVNQTQQREHEPRNSAERKLEMPPSVLTAFFQYGVVVGDHPQ